MYRWNFRIVVKCYLDLAKTWIQLKLNVFVENKRDKQKSDKTKKKFYKGHVM